MTRAQKGEESVVSTNQPQAMSNYKKVIALWDPRLEGDFFSFGAKCRCMWGKQRDSMIETRAPSGLVWVGCRLSAALLTQLPASEWSLLDQGKAAERESGSREDAPRGEVSGPSLEITLPMSPLPRRPLRGSTDP